MVEAWGGEHQLRSLLAICTPSVPNPDTGHLTKDFPSGAEIAVRAGWSFQDWAVIMSHQTVTGWFCTSCSNVHSCDHVSTADVGSEVQPHLTLEKDQFEAKLKKEFDTQTGESPFSFYLCFGIQSSVNYVMQTLIRQQVCSNCFPSVR